MTRFFSEFRITLRRGLALFFFRRQTPNAPAPRPIVLVVLAAIWLASFGILSWLWAGEQREFNEFGLNAIAASWIMFFALIVLFSRNLGRPPVTRAFADVMSIKLIALFVVHLVAVGGEFAGIDIDDPSSISMLLGAAAVGLYVWQLAAIGWAGRSVFPGSVQWPRLKLLAAAVLPVLLVPGTDMIRSASLPEGRVDVWSWADTYRSFFPEEETEAAKTERPRDYEAALCR
jgi:hypothetical protein